MPGVRVWGHRITVIFSRNTNMRMLRWNPVASIHDKLRGRTLGGDTVVMKKYDLYEANAVAAIISSSEKPLEA
jgi:hypothetical protein